MLRGSFTEEELDECCSPLPCEFCDEPTDDEHSIEVEITRTDARTLYFLYCSEEHLREHLSRPLPTPEPDPLRPSGSAAEQGTGIGCSLALLTLAGALLLLGVLAGLGVPLW